MKLWVENRWVTSCDKLYKSFVLFGIDVQHGDDYTHNCGRLYITLNFFNFVVKILFGEDKPRYRDPN